MGYSHEEFASQGSSPTDVTYFSNIISGHYYNKLYFVVSSGVHNLKPVVEQQLCNDGGMWD